MGSGCCWPEVPATEYDIFISRALPLTTGGGRAPLWSPDGQNAHYWRGWTDLHAIPMRVAADVTAGASRRLFTLPTASVSWARAYDVSKDGRRFIIPRLGDPEVVEVTRLNLVQGFLEELKTRVSAGR